MSTLSLRDWVHWSLPRRAVPEEENKLYVLIYTLSMPESHSIARVDPIAILRNSST